MPLGPFEREILALVAGNRSPASFVAGATVLHSQPDSPRTSRAIDVFHDTVEALQAAAEVDLRTLRQHGFQVDEVLTQPTIRRAVVQRESLLSKVEWAHDSAFRFFPLEPDPVLGWRLSFWDAATNKLLAMVGRHEFRDYVDVLYLHRRHLHLAALAWAAAGKDPGLTPEFILDWLRRSTRYSPAELTEVQLSSPPELGQMKRELLQACAEAEELFSRLPTSEMGCLYLDGASRPVLPNPSDPGFLVLTRQLGSVGGSQPRTPGP